MASIEYQNSILWRGDDPLKAKWTPKLDGSKKVTRHFPPNAITFVPGKLPQKAEEAKKKAEAEKHKLKERGDLSDQDRDHDRDRDRKKRRRARDVQAAVIEEGSRQDAASSRLRRLKGVDSETREGESSSRLKRLEAVDPKPREDAASSRLKRLNQSSGQCEVAERVERHRRHQIIHEARILESTTEQDEEERGLRVNNEEHERGTTKAEKVEEPNADRGPLAELPLPRYDDISGEEEEDIELRALRRERARFRALEKRQDEEMAIRAKKEEPKDEIDDEDEDSYEEDDSDDDDPRTGHMMKPVFVSKTQRDTVKEREAIEAEEEKFKERDAQRKLERKAESKTLLVDTIRVEEEAEAAADEADDRSDAELIDDNDEINEAEEYEMWKIRELKRIKRDKEERFERQKEVELIERRRRMTDAERAEDDRKMDEGMQKKEDTKNFGFLQKYYHRGAFFQDKARTGEEPLYLRDVHEPLEEEKFDKQALPAAMQLRRGQFGKKGQVKHTHLTDVDTTDRSAAWAQHSKQTEKYTMKLAGVKGANQLDRPRGARRD